MDVGIENTSSKGEVYTMTSSLLIRRLHQIQQSLFCEEADRFDITLVQMNVLSAIARQAGRDQSSIAEEIGADKATLASVLTRLEAASLIRRTISKTDQRQKLLNLTAKGKRLVDKMREPLLRANARTLEPLAPHQRAQFLSLLAVLVNGGNEKARTRLRLPTDS